VPSASLIAPDLPPEIDAFFARALARERAERFQSVGEMMGELRRVAGMASPSIPDLQCPCSGVPSTARPRLSGTIALDAKLDEPAAAPRSASPGTLTSAGSTSQEARLQRPQRARQAIGIAMAMLVGASVTIALRRGGSSAGGDAKVTSAGAPASEEVAASSSAEVEPSPEPLESVTPAAPIAEVTGSAADAAGETAAPPAPPTSTTAARPPSSATPRTPHTGIPAPSRRPPIPPTTAPGPDRAPIPEVPF
jgi:serine/threonine-protein kinase